MATVGGFSRHKHLSELGSILRGEAGGLVTADARRALTLSNLGIVTVAADVATMATQAEVNAVADLSTRIVAIADATNALVITEALHNGKTLFNLDASLTIAFPTATGSGMSFKFVLGIAATAVVFSATPDDFIGTVLGADTDGGTGVGYLAGATDNTITLNGVATGGKLGDWLEFTDIAADEWYVTGFVSQSGGSEATPFSAV